MRKSHQLVWILLAVVNLALLATGGPSALVAPWYRILLMVGFAVYLYYSRAQFWIISIVLGIVGLTGYLLFPILALGHWTSWSVLNGMDLLTLYDLSCLLGLTTMYLFCLRWAVPGGKMDEFAAQLKADPQKYELYGYRLQFMYRLLYLMGIFSFVGWLIFYARLDVTSSPSFLFEFYFILFSCDALSNYMMYEQTYFPSHQFPLLLTLVVVFTLTHQISLVYALVLGNKFLNLGVLLKECLTLKGKQVD